MSSVRLALKLPFRNHGLTMTLVCWFVVFGSATACASPVSAPGFTPMPTPTVPIITPAPPTAPVIPSPTPAPVQPGSSGTFAGLLMRPGISPSSTVAPTAAAIPVLPLTASPPPTLASSLSAVSAAGEEPASTPHPAAASGSESVNDPASPTQVPVPPPTTAPVSVPSPNPTPATTATPPPSPAPTLTPTPTRTPQPTATPLPPPTATPGRPQLPRRLLLPRVLAVRIRWTLTGPLSPTWTRSAI